MCKCKTKCGCNITSTTKGEKGDVNSSAALGYKVYVAILDQTGTDAFAVDTIFKNTLTVTPVHTRSAIGRYVMTSTDFVVGKVYISGMTDFNGSGNTVITLWDESAIIGYLQIYCNQTANMVGFEVFDATFTRVDWVTLMGVSKLCFPEIRVYP